MMTDTPDKQTAPAAAGLITPDEAAAMLGLDKVSADPRKAVLRMARRGEIESRLVGQWRLIVRASVERFIEEGQG